MIPILSFPSTTHSFLTSTVNFPPRPLKSAGKPPSAAVRCRSTAVAPPPVTSLYEVLGLCTNASPSEIKAAYRSLAKRYHPDARSPAPEEDPGHRRRSFVEINDAYETLSDSGARAVYDSSIGLLGRVESTSFERGSASVVVGPMRFRVNPTRKWETDQCW